MVVRYYRYIIQFLILLAVVIWIGVFQQPNNNLRVISCDVGQGDATLVTFKNIQILTDGGPNNKVLDCLSGYMPFWDREIELVILTHPEKDHYFGLIEVVRRYKVDNFLYNKLSSSTQDYQLLEKEVGRRGIVTITPNMGKRIRVGLIYLDILHPFEGFQSSKTNEYSIVYKLSYLNFKAIFTGDIDQKISNSLLNNSTTEHVDYIKIPHHGSRNGMTLNLLNSLMPKIAVISVGKNNSYGHPHKEIIEMLNDLKVQILRTDELGNVVITVNEKGYWMGK